MAPRRWLALPMAESDNRNLNPDPCGNQHQSQKVIEPSHSTDDPPRFPPMHTGHLGFAQALEVGRDGPLLTSGPGCNSKNPATLFALVPRPGSARQRAGTLAAPHKHSQSRSKARSTSQDRP